MGIGTNIQATRQASGLTQEQLASDVGVSRQTVARWESGETSPDLDHAAALAGALGCTVDAPANFDSKGTGPGAPPRGRHLFGNVKVGERGQVVILKEAREVFDIKPGDKLVVLGEDGRGIALCKESDFMACVEAFMAAARRGARWAPARRSPSCSPQSRWRCSAHFSSTATATCMPRSAIRRSIDAGFVEKQATVGGAAINYAGGPDSGPALLLVHGQGMEWEGCASVLPQLSERHRVFAVDCFGHGESERDAALCSCEANGDSLIEFARDVIGESYAVSGHSSGGIIAAYIAANDPENVAALVLEDPPLFRVTPEEAQEGAGTFAWHDGHTVAHSFLQPGEVSDYAAWYASQSYLFGLFGGLQPWLADQTAAWCANHPDEHVVNAWVPRAWTRGMCFMDDYDPRFGEAFYDGSWMAGIDQEAMLQQIERPTVHLKATTHYGDDGVLYAATTDDDAARVRDCLADCEYVEIESGHGVHVEHPNDSIGAVARVA